MQIQFWIPGVPATAGSKTAFPYKDKNTGKIRVAMAPANKRQKPWMSDVKAFALDAYKGTPATGQVGLYIDFYLPRPKSHFGAGKNVDTLKDSAPSKPVTKPDLTKLTRAIEDALKNIIWRDDSQVVTQNISKHYSLKPGAMVTIVFAEAKKKDTEKVVKHPITGSKFTL